MNIYELSVGNECVEIETDRIDLFADQDEVITAEIRKGTEVIVLSFEDEDITLRIWNGERWQFVSDGAKQLELMYRSLNE